VILDINLPTGSGFDVCKAIRAARKCGMMLTARGEEEGPSCAHSSSARTII
jgi:DNA-binding response OmpR family regulator